MNKSAEKKLLKSWGWSARAIAEMVTDSDPQERMRKIGSALLAAFERFETPIETLALPTVRDYPPGLAL